MVTLVKKLRNNNNSRRSGSITSLDRKSIRGRKSSQDLSEEGRFGSSAKKAKSGLRERYGVDPDQSKAKQAGVKTSIGNYNRNIRLVEPIDTAYGGSSAERNIGTAQPQK